MHEIPSLLKNNDIYLKTCILYEVLHKKPVFESYRNFCEKIGNDAMSYVDFEYWYYRFYNGELDFSHERTHTHRTVLQLPPEMCDLIFKELSCRERMVMRSVSKAMKTIADGQVEMHDSMYMHIRDNLLCVLSFINIQLKTWKYICYSQNGHNTGIMRETTHKNNVEGNFMEIGLKGISSYINYRNIRTKEMDIALKRNAPDLTQFFPYRFFSKKITFLEIFDTNYLAILERLEPGYLEVILLFFESKEIDNSKIFDMAQFQQAKFVYFMDSAFKFDDLTHFYRFKGFSVVLDNLTVEEAIVMRDTLAGLPYFEGCTIYMDNVDFNFLKVGLDLEEMLSVEEKVTYRYPIANTNTFLEFTFHVNCFEVEKMCS